MSNHDELREEVERLRNLMRDYVTRGQGQSMSRAANEQATYAELREHLLGMEEISPILPRWVKTHETLSAFHQTMQTEYSHYQGRRNAIQEAFAPILAKLEGDYVSVIDTETANALEQLGLEHVEENWRRALARVTTEPDAAITSARSMLESLYKSLLDEHKIKYSNDVDLPKLHRLVTEQLDFTPEQQVDKSLKTITGNVQSIVSQLAFLRNNVSDSHGQGQDYYQPVPELAEFVVNLAGSLAILVVRLHLSK